MRKIYLFHATYGQVFWEKEGEIIGAVHENDLLFEVGNLNQLLNHLGAECEKCHDAPDWLTIEKLAEWGVED